MDVRNSILKIIGEISGSWDVAAAYLGMTPAALRNRAYEVKGQALRTEHALALQALVENKHFAQAVATASGGTFVLLPAGREDDGGELITKFHELYAELGTLSAHFTAATADHKINQRERADLEAIGAAIHRTVSELLALTFRIYCPQQAKAPMLDGEAH